MTKMRVYEYAKKNELASKQVIEQLKKMNVEVSNHMSTVEDDVAKQLDQAFGKNQPNTEAKKTDSQKNNKSSNKQQKPNQKNQKNNKNKNQKNQKPSNQQQTPQKKQKKQTPEKVTFSGSLTVGE
ncbi:MAG: translation initiation factor IF-2 N-terminal domain-containing protein, partial [Halobacillus sp.]